MYWVHKYLILLLILLFINCIHTNPDETYDFILVGLGTAGAVLANRLSENGKYSVLALERGGNPNILTAVPALAPVMGLTENAERYLLEKQQGFHMGLEDERVAWLVGKGIGGSSLINYLLYTRGHRDDYNKWASMGNSGWSYEEISPFFRKSENASLIKNVNPSIRGTEGEMNVNESPYRTKSVGPFIEGCKEIGIDHLQDYNSGNPFGAGYVQANTIHGRRCHTKKAFLDNIKDRKNLRIIAHALVTRLLVNKENNSIDGVIYRRGLALHQAKARKEVILSAGALNSPKLLMLSGIGPRKHLEELEIEVVKDLPVGQTIYDHAVFPGVVFKLNETITPLLHNLLNPINLVEFLFKGKGMYTVPAAIGEAFAFVKTTVSNETTDYPDSELIYACGSLSLDYGILIRRLFNINSPTYNAMYRPLQGKHVWSLLVLLLHPESRGYMRLRSTDPSDKPKIYGNYFTDPDRKDIKTMTAAIRIAQKIAKAPSLAKYGSEVYLGAVPGCEKEKVDSDSFWECQIRQFAVSIWHPMATCKMGPQDDPSAVVDNELRVYGMKKLRVIDASVIPTAPSGHTMVPTIMIAEKGADLILKAHSR